MEHPGIDGNKAAIPTRLTPTTNGSDLHDYTCSIHDDVIKWKHFLRYWPFVRGIHRSPVNSPHKGQWRGALMFSLICAWIKGWVSNGEAGDLRRHRAHFDVTVMPRKVRRRYKIMDMTFWWKYSKPCPLDWLSNFKTYIRHIENQNILPKKNNVGKNLLKLN